MHALAHAERVQNKTNHYKTRAALPVITQSQMKTTCYTYGLTSPEHTMQSNTGDVLMQGNCLALLQDLKRTSKDERNHALKLSMQRLHSWRPNYNKHKLESMWWPHSDVTVLFTSELSPASLNFLWQIVSNKFHACSINPNPYSNTYFNQTEFEWLLWAPGLFFYLCSNTYATTSNYFCRF